MTREEKVMLMEAANLLEANKSYSKSSIYNIILSNIDHLKQKDPTMARDTENEVEFTEVKSSSSKQLVDITNIPRHHLMKDVGTTHIEKNIDEAKLDLELGLKGQLEFEIKDIIRKDINEILKGKDYYPVTQSQLEKLFGLGKLKWKCRWINYVNMWKTAPFLMFFFHLFNIVGVVFPAIMISVIASKLAYLSLVSLALNWISMIFLDYTEETRSTTHKKGLKNLNITYLNVFLKTEGVESTKIKIPYGAKLRLKEAMESKIFDRFIIAYPAVVKEHRKAPEPISRDPAIMGVNVIDGEEYWSMVVYWDIEKDKEKINSQINHFRSLKI